MIPTPPPATVLSQTQATPTVLPASSTNFTLTASTAGDIALDWSYNETNAVAVNTEFELQFLVHYTSGGTPTTFRLTVFIESQSTKPATNVTFDIFWDTGATTGIVFTDESDVIQHCAAVNKCP
jgi:hypothetical protein